MTVPDNRINASDDVIGALSERVADLSKRVSAVQTELEVAQKRLAVYEEFDATVQEALSGALRAAYQIRERAEATANQILEQAREERRLLLKEVERLREERDALMDEVAHARRGGIAAVAPPQPRAAAADVVSASELRALATEALRSMFKEIAQDMRAAPAPPAAPPEAAPTSRPEPVAERVVTPPPAPATPPPSETIEDVETPTPARPPEPEPERTPLFAVPTVETPAAAVEDTEVAPQMAPEREERSTPSADISVVLSPVASFARLVDLERRIQTLPIVRSLYVRDFRGGVATLAVGLRSAMTPGEFAGAVSTLGPPAMRAVSTSGNTIQLRLEGDASIA